MIQIKRIGMRVGFRVALVAAILVSASPFSAPIASAALPYQAEVSDGYVTLAPGQVKLITLKFKNAGTETWRPGTDKVAVFLYGNSTPLAHSSWHKADLPKPIEQSAVKPGHMASASFYIKAPTTPGIYRERFLLSSGPDQWIKGSVVPVTFTVTASSAPSAEPTAQPEPTGGTEGYQSVLLLTSHRQVALSGNARIELTHGFKNSGTSAWETRGLKFVAVTPSDRPGATVKDASWLSETEATNVGGTTKPGEIGFVSYVLKAPALSGNYTVTFQLTADGKEIPGGEIDIPVTVTADGVVDPNPIPIPDVPIQDPTSGEPPILDELAGQLPDQPIIRVGVYATTDDTTKVRGIQGGVKALKNGVVVCTYEKSQEVKLFYNRSSGVYSLTGPGCSDSGSQYYILEAHDGMAPLEVTDFYRPVSWLPGANDNTFRARLELRYTPKTDKVWLINELPVEEYLYGLAETSDVSPLEYQKALLTAARTYAMYHVNRGTKHANEFYTVDAKYDQVYRGYGQEARSPNIVKGIAATRGYIVTYDGKLAITPYFSRSDGRTRNWNEVWGGSGYPWLVSVPVPHDIGQTLWGHGVGMTARGALYMASKDGAQFDAILKHFYQGTEIKRAYK